jgi:hypothetical protein
VSWRDDNRAARRRPQLQGKGLAIAQAETIFNDPIVTDLAVDDMPTKVSANFNHLKVAVLYCQGIFDGVFEDAGFR